MVLPAAASSFELLPRRPAPGSNDPAGAGVFEVRVSCRRALCAAPVAGAALLNSLAMISFHREH